MPPGVQCDPRNSSGAEQGPPRGPRSVPGQVSTGRGAAVPACPPLQAPGFLPTWGSVCCPQPLCQLPSWVKADPLAHVPGPRGPRSLSAVSPGGTGPPPRPPSCRCQERRWPRVLGRGGGLRVHRAPSSSSPEGALGGDPPPHHLTSRPPRTETTAPAPAPAFSSPHTSASTGPGSGSTWTLPRPCTL